MNPNLYAVLSSGFPADRAKVAIQTPEREYTWNDLERTSARIANFLAGLGLSAGARVAAQVEKTPEALMLYLGVIRAGYTYLPLNTAYRESEVTYFLEDAQPELVVCDPASLAGIQEIASARGIAHVCTLDSKGAGSLIDSLDGCADAFETVAVDPHDLATILYTSGTTGRSKGAMLSHRNLSSNTQVLNSYWGWRQDDVLLHMLPIFHIHGLFVAAGGALLAGARMIWLPRLDIDQAVHYLPQCTVMMGVPTYYVRLLADARFDRALCRNVRLFVSGSAPLLADTFDAFRERIGQPILERYGMSETMMLTSNPYDPAQGPRLAGTVGVPLPGVSVRVADANDQPLPAGEIGRIQVKGPNVFSGYWRMPEKTREEFTADGWFTTGDLGCWGARIGETQSPPDYLSIVGRSKDLIISGGFNVYPKEIEALLDDIPGVQESAVIGVPHPDFGEAVVAILVPRAGATLDADAIVADLKNRIANFKVPKQVHIVDQLPRNTMGKVQKNVLRDSWHGSFQAAGASR